MKVVWNVPNILTLLRVIAAPLLAYLLMRRYYEYALYVFLAAAITDALDGYIARQYHLDTEFGAALDPLADKLITLTCLLILSVQGRVPWWLTLPLVLRDVVIVIGAFTYHHRFGDIDIQPTRLGKIHTFAVFILFVLVLAHAAQVVNVQAWLTACFAAILFTTLASLTQYVVLWARKAAQQTKAPHESPDK